MNVQCFNFYIQAQQPYRFNWVKRFVLWLLGLKLHHIDGALALYRIGCVIEGFGVNEGMDAATTNMYGENQYWRVVSKSDTSFVVLESKKPIRFVGFDGQNGVGGRIHFYYDRSLVATEKDIERLRKKLNIKLQERQSQLLSKTKTAVK